MLKKIETKYSRAFGTSLWPPLRVIIDLFQSEKRTCDLKLGTFWLMPFLASPSTYRKFPYLSAFRTCVFFFLFVIATSTHYNTPSTSTCSWITMLYTYVFGSSGSLSSTAISSVNAVKVSSSLLNRQLHDHTMLKLKCYIYINVYFKYSQRATNWYQEHGLGMSCQLTVILSTLLTINYLDTCIGCRRLAISHISIT